jgi:two-component system sensor kinase FixL
VGDPVTLVALLLLAVSAIAIAWLNQRRRSAENAHRLAAAQGAARAERLDAIFNTAVDGIIVINDKGIIEAVNPAVVRMFGYVDREIIGQNVNILMPSPYREEHDGYIARYLATGQAKIIGTGRQVTARRKDGTTFPVQLAVGQFSLAGERKFTGIVHDLSARLHLEEQLREHAALAWVGEMAAVIAHEVRNPLAGIRGAVQTMGAQLAPESRNAAMIKEIVARIDSLNELMKDLLLFARPPQPRSSPTEIVPLIRMTANLLRQDPAFRDVQIDVDGSGPAIPADAEMLKIVFHNLLVNGAHAMAGGGRIRVGVEAENGACRIRFSDHGPGIPAEVRDKIFTPFFTTKARGTGLGLPTAKRLVEAHNGQIAVECPPGGGTTVTVTLPIANSE